MSCKYCEIKMRPIDEDTKVLKGENWSDEYGEGGYIGQSYDDKFRMTVYYDAGFAGTCVDNIKYCPFCGAELTLPKEPLIKDESVRKQLRKWADCYGYRKVLAHSTLRQFWSLDGERTLEIYDDYDSDNLIEDGEYSVEELCGEEEE